MNTLALTIIHPDYEQLKKMGRFFHLVAGLLILLHAFFILWQPVVNNLYFWCQLFIAADIIIMAFVTRNLAQDLPNINTTFRFIECIVFVAAGITFLLQANYITGFTLLLIGSAYSYLLVCERKIINVEMVAFHHIGITISGIPKSDFFLWSRINRVEAHYDSIIIETADKKTYEFRFRQNLQFEEMDQIHEFCRHYLKQAVYQ